MMLKLNALPKENCYNFHSKEINGKVIELLRNNSVPSEEILILSLFISLTSSQNYLKSCCFFMIIIG